MADWWKTFFDRDYARLWGSAESQLETDRLARSLWSLLKLKQDSTVLDAPCGYGRISRRLAQLGARVLGVDYSEALLAEADRRREGLASPQLRYVQQDLRVPLGESGFDVAINIFSSLGYGTETDDLEVLSNLREAVRQGGSVFIETNHRDNVVISQQENRRPADRLPDGSIMVEEPHFDPATGRVETTWYWSGPNGSGQKSASLRVYSATELVRLVEDAGLKVQSLHAGCSEEPFAPGGDLRGRLGVLAKRQ